MKEEDAVIVIQKSFRSYLERKKKYEKPSDFGCSTKEVRDEDRLYAKRVLEEVNTFFEKYKLNIKKKEKIRNLCLEIDELSDNLKSVTTLRQCKEIETSFSNCDNEDIFIKKHQDQLKQFNLKWWEKLDIIDNNKSD